MQARLCCRHAVGRLACGGTVNSMFQFTNAALRDRWDAFRCIEPRPCGTMVVRRHILQSFSDSAGFGLSAPGHHSHVIRYVTLPQAREASSRSWTKRSSRWVWVC